MTPGVAGLGGGGGTLAEGGGGPGELSPDVLVSLGRGGPTLGYPQPLELLDLGELVAVQAEGGALILRLRGQEVTMKVRGTPGQWGHLEGGSEGTERTGFQDWEDKGAGFGTGTAGGLWGAEGRDLGLQRGQDFGTGSTGGRRGKDLGVQGVQRDGGRWDLGPGGYSWEGSRDRGQATLMSCHRVPWQMKSWEMQEMWRGFILTMTKVGAGAARGSRGDRDPSVPSPRVPPQMKVPRDLALLPGHFVQLREALREEQKSRDSPASPASPVSPTPSEP